MRQKERKNQSTNATCLSMVLFITLKWRYLLKITQLLTIWEEISLTEVFCSLKIKTLISWFVFSIESRDSYRSLSPDVFSSFFFREFMLKRSKCFFTLFTLKIKIFCMKYRLVDIRVFSIESWNRNRSLSSYLRTFFLLCSLRVYV